MKSPKEVFISSIAMFVFNVEKYLFILLLIKVSSFETRPAPLLQSLINGLIGGIFPRMYPTGYGAPPTYAPPGYGAPPAYAPPGYGAPPAYSQYPPMLDLKNPVPLYPNQPMPALYAQNPQQPNPNQAPNSYPWPQLTMTPPPPYTLYPTTGLPGFGANLGAGIINFAQAQGGAIRAGIHSLFEAFRSILGGSFPYPPGPWVPM